MSREITEKEQKFLEILKYYSKLVLPTYKEIENKLGVSSNQSVDNYFDQLENKGLKIREIFNKHTFNILNKECDICKRVIPIEMITGIKSVEMSKENWKLFYEIFDYIGFQEDVVNPEPFFYHGKCFWNKKEFKKLNK